MHAENVELHLLSLLVGVQRCHRPERRGAGVGTQDGDVATGQLVAQTPALRRVGQVDRPHLDGDAVLLA